MTRDMTARYQSLADAIKFAVMPMEHKSSIIKESCGLLKALDPKFDVERFSRACWTNEEW